MKNNSRELVRKLRALTDDGFSEIVADLIESGREDLIKQAEAYANDPTSEPDKRLSKAVLKVYELEA